MLKFFLQIQHEKRFEIFLEVSDGIKTSPIVSLQAYVTPLQLRMVNNTGLNMIHGSSQVISSFNLSFATNTKNYDLDLKYTIVFPPLWGTIEKQRLLDGSWTQINSFTNNQLNLGQIRYSHLHGNPPQDEFKVLLKVVLFFIKEKNYSVTFFLP